MFTIESYFVDLSTSFCSTYLFFSKIILYIFEIFQKKKMKKKNNFVYMITILPNTVYRKVKKK